MLELNPRETIKQMQVSIGCHSLKQEFKDYG